MRCCKRLLLCSVLVLFIYLFIRNGKRQAELSSVPVSGGSFLPWPLWDAQVKKKEKKRQKKENEEEEEHEEATNQLTAMVKILIHLRIFVFAYLEHLQMYYCICGVVNTWWLILGLSHASL